MSSSPSHYGNYFIPSTGPQKQLMAQRVRNIRCCEMEAPGLSHGISLREASGFWFPLYDCFMDPHASAIHLEKVSLKSNGGWCPLGPVKEKTNNLRQSQLIFPLRNQFLLPVEFCKCNSETEGGTHWCLCITR